MNRLVAFGCVVLCLTGGCARNAIFELELDLPPQPPGVAPRFAVLQVRDDADFTADWSGVEQLDGIPLNPSCPRPAAPVTCSERELTIGCSAIVSVVGSADRTRPLRVRVRFCEDRACASVNDRTAPETRVEVERAFYEGRYTQGRVCIDALPLTSTPEPSVLERCAVRCRDGDAVTYCRADGTHFCESP